MKINYLIYLFCIIGGISSASGQITIHSTCLNDTSIYICDLEEFSHEIALSEMRKENHQYHDSILVSRLFLDSINNYLSAYNNAIYLSDSIIDYRDFSNYNLDIAEIILTFTNTSNCFKKQNNTLIITNDTLSKYIDSLRLSARSYNENEIILSDTNSLVNMYGNFEFFYNIPAITNIKTVIMTVDMIPCYKSRSGYFIADELKLNFADINYCENNSYSHNWNYSVTNDCDIEILNIPTSISYHADNNSANIYPNPFSNLLNIETDELIKNIRIISPDKRVVKTKTTPYNYSINVSDLKPGLYIVEILYENNIVQYRNVLKRE